MRGTWLAIMGMAALMTAGPAVAGTYSVLYQFGSNPSAGERPGSLVALPSGSLVGMAYVGVTPNGGSLYSIVFKLDPPAAGQTAWNYSVIYDSRNFPLAGQAFGYPAVKLNPGIFGRTPPFLVDGSGNVYGTTSELTTTLPRFDDAGTIYRLSPPPLGNGSWNCTILYHHFNSRGLNIIPQSVVYIDHTSRHLYGVGQFFHLDPSAGAGSLTIPGYAIFRLDLADPPVMGTLSTISPFVDIQRATNTYVAVVPTREGAFYGDYFNDDLFGDRPNSVFRLAPSAPGAPQGLLQTLANPPLGGGVVGPSLTVDLSDRITGVGYNDHYGSYDNLYGVVWQLSPPAAAGGVWQPSVLYSFKGAAGQDGSTPTQILQHNGLFYGTTWLGGRTTIGTPHTDPENGRGTLFELAAPPAASSAKTWTEHPVHQFAGQSAGDGERPVALTQATGLGGTYALYGVTDIGGSFDKGTIFRYVP